MILDALGNEISIGDFCSVARPAPNEYCKMEQKPMLLARIRNLSKEDVETSEVIRSKLPNDRLSNLIIEEGGVLEVSFIFGLDLFGLDSAGKYDCLNLYRLPIGDRILFPDIIFMPHLPYYINNPKVAKLFELRDRLLCGRLSFDAIDFRSNLMKMFG